MAFFICDCVKDVIESLNVFTYFHFHSILEQIESEKITFKYTNVSFDALLWIYNYLEEQKKGTTNYFVDLQRNIQLEEAFIKMVGLKYEKLYEYMIDNTIHFLT